MSPTLEILAPAKLNLSLSIVGRRADGYHLIDSFVGFCSLADRLEITFTHKPGRVFFEGPFGKDVKMTNTVTEAISAFQAIRDPGLNLSVRVEKNIPVAAGLGGGSADGAAVLRALRDFAGPISAETLYNIALSLGADMPACLASTPLIMRGIGEHLCALPSLPRVGVVLVNPLLALCTKSVFRDFHGPYSAPSKLPAGPLDAEALFNHLGTRATNDLIRPATRRLPVITNILERLATLPGARTVGMSGSGATCFALFPSANMETVLAAASAIRSEGFWASGTELLTGGDPVTQRAMGRYFD